MGTPRTVITGSRTKQFNIFTLYLATTVFTSSNFTAPTNYDKEDRAEDEGADDEGADDEGADDEEARCDANLLHLMIALILPMLRCCIDSHLL